MKNLVFLKKGISKTIENEAKVWKEWFLILLRTLGASFLGNLLTGKGTIRAGEGKNRAFQDFYCCPTLIWFWNTKVLSKWT